MLQPGGVRPLKAATIFVVDSDPQAHHAARMLFASVGHRVEAFISAERFLAVRDPNDPGCLISEVRLPDISGLELQRRLVGAGDRLPVIFATAHGDMMIAVQAMKAGAADFLPKPYREHDMLEAIQGALRLDRQRHEARMRADEALAGYRTLTAREREIMCHVIDGKINKQIAAVIGISDVTVKVHRAQVMRKMAAGSVAELVRMADRLAAETLVDRVDLRESRGRP